MEPHNSIGTANTSATTVFTGNTLIKTFKELVYFVNLKTLGRYFVGNCSNLTEIHIPSSVTRIGSYAFHNAIRMKKVLCYPLSAPNTDVAIFGNTSQSSMGYNGRTSRTNEFHVPVVSTGYEQGDYSSRLQSTSYCGFRVIYDL